MKKQKEISTKKAAPMIAPKAEETAFAPIFVEAEKMFEYFNNLNREIGHKAFELFMKRGGEFGKAFEDWLEAESEILTPIPVEIIENKEQFRVLAKIHGFKPEEIEVCIKDNLVFLSGEADTMTEKEDEDAIYKEWHHDRFFRALPFSDKIDVDHAEANWKDGILQITLPKLPEDKPKNIAIEKA